MIICLILFLGLFFQYNRSDGFIRLIRNKNVETVTASLKESGDVEKNLPVERFVIVYDAESVNSLFLRRSIEKTAKYLKKDVVAIEAKAYTSQKQNYDGIILALENLDQVKNMDSIRDYVRQGGSVYFMFRPTPGVAFNQMYQEMGFSRVDGIADVSGIKMNTNLLIGGKGFELNDDDYKTSAVMGALNPGALIHMSSQGGVPLLWEYNFGKGKYIVYNGSSLSDKVNRGVMTAMLGLGKEIYVYPTVGIKVIFIDDFPAPIPEGRQDKIYKEFQLTSPQFYRQVWWPDMLATAQKYNIRYTGLIIETYNDKVVPPFEPDKDTLDHNNLIIYGRELLKSGGELGIHGYNHQPLAPKGYQQEELSYNAWTSQDDMVRSLQELKRYVQNVYPDYNLKVYVPPSNILSPEGKEAVMQAFPDLKVFASLYTAGREESKAYIQEFTRNDNGVVEMPRISSDYIRSDNTDWVILNTINSIGIFTHFVHPDELFYPESAEYSWKDMHHDFESLMKEIQENYSWLRSSTASRGAEYMEDYFNLQYRMVQGQDKLTIYCWGFKDEAFFILKSPKKIVGYQGCQVERIDDNVYLLKISESEVTIQFEKEVKQ